MRDGCGRCGNRSVQQRGKSVRSCKHDVTGGPLWTRCCIGDSATVLRSFAEDFSGDVIQIECSGLIAALEPAKHFGCWRRGIFRRGRQLNGRLVLPPVFVSLAVWSDRCRRHRRFHSRTALAIAGAEVRRDEGDSVGTGRRRGHLGTRSGQSNAPLSDADGREFLPSLTVDASVRYRPVRRRSRLNGARDRRCGVPGAKRDLRPIERVFWRRMHLGILDARFLGSIIGPDGGVVERTLITAVCTSVGVAGGCICVRHISSSVGDPKCDHIQTCLEEDEATRGDFGRHEVAAFVEYVWRRRVDHHKMPPPPGRFASIQRRRASVRWRARHGMA